MTIHICNIKGPHCPLDCRHAVPHNPIDFGDGRDCAMDSDYCGEYWKGKGYDQVTICVPISQEVMK